MKIHGKMFVSLALIIMACNAMAGVYYQGKQIMSAASGDIRITFMKWGTHGEASLQHGSSELQITDRIVGQISSKEYENVTLCFESNATDGKIYTVTIDTAVHCFGKDKEHWECKECEQPYHRKKRDVSKFPAGGGWGGRGRFDVDTEESNQECAFEAFFDRVTKLGTLKLVDVKANGKSIRYDVRFNTTNELRRNPMKVSVAKNITTHECNAAFSSRDIPAPEEKSKEKPQVQERPSSTPTVEQDNDDPFEGPVKTGNEIASAEEIETLTAPHLSIRIFLDGKCTIMMRGENIWLEHNVTRDENGKMTDFPGKSGGKNFPVYLNGKPWSPKWNGTTAVPFEMPCGKLPAERVSTFTVKPAESTRAKVTVMDRPREKNDFTATIRIEDTAPGAAWCEFDVDWE